MVGLLSKRLTLIGKNKFAGIPLLLHPAILGVRVLGLLGRDHIFFIFKKGT